MPHKVNCGFDYDDDYDDYEDYDYDEENGKAAAVNQEKFKPGVWRCAICTYDNDESMSYCDICGVLRVPPSNTSSNAAKKAAPFKFDVPSPDDVVFCGLHSSATTRKDFPSSIAKQNASMKTQSGDKRTDNGISFKGRSHTSEEQNNSSTNGGISLDDSSNMTGKNYAVKASSSAKKLDSSAETLKVKQNIVADSSYLVTEGNPASLMSSLNNVSLNVKFGSSKHTAPQRTSSQQQYKPEKWMLPEQGEDGVMTQLNLAVVGHVDSGKSTLSGRLLHLLGKISQKEMHKYEREAKLQGKGSFAYAWALDESAEERERGITMTVAVAYFDTKRYHVVVLDSPGHKDFVPNMISGATQADAAILVVDASVGSFEAGMDNTWGQTREHAQLIRSFGIDQIIVAINKMDTVDYSKERFELIKQQVGSFLRSCGFKDFLTSWIPLSAMDNQNLVAVASDIRLKSWYHGPHLFEAIDSLSPPTRDYSKPLRMPICDVIKSQSMGQVSASGKLEAGAVRSGCKVLVMPLGDVATVRSIECNSRPCPIARAGDNVAVSLQGIDFGHVIAGGVLCHPDFPVRVATRLELKVLVLDVATPILIGSQLEFHIHHAREAATVVKIVSLVNPKTGTVTKKAPRCLVGKQSAVIEVSLQGAVCVEEFSNCRALGRVFLRASGKTVSVGVVTQIIEDDK
ncbi:hypothetical protein Ancab_023134 [Ancistrocladus abbreviatus]